jgi:predicted MFS family arabinose efflux permease
MNSVLARHRVTRACCTGRYNLAQGASAASWGLGAGMSNSVAGFIANSFGYSAAFLFLAACAVVALLVFWLGVPETRDAEAAVATQRSEVQSGHVRRIEAVATVPVSDARCRQLALRASLFGRTGA